MNKVDCKLNDSESRRKTHVIAGYCEGLQRRRWLFSLLDTISLIDQRFPKQHIYYLIFLFLFLQPSLSIADTVYKSIDSDGNVTYSTVPPDNSKQSTSVTITPPPSEERVKAAQGRHDKNKEAAVILDENRKTREQMIAEDNRLKREKQRQLQQQQQAEKNNENQDYSYPHYRRGINTKPGHHVTPSPARPATRLPARLPAQHHVRPMSR